MKPEPWFGDRNEIERAIETLRDLGAALRSPGLTKKQEDHLAREGLPFLRQILDSALAPWAARQKGPRARRAPNTFEKPLFGVCDLLYGVRHAGELDEDDLVKLRRLLLEAHLARLDADSTHSVLQQIARARKPRKDVTREQLLAHREKYKKKHAGKDRGWQEAARIDFNISPKTLRKRIRE